MFVNPNAEEVKSMQRIKEIIEIDIIGELVNLLDSLAVLPLHSADLTKV